MTIQLADHQQAAVSAVLSDYTFEGINRLIIQMATGAGKTITAAALASALFSGEAPLFSGRCLFLAHRDKLVESAYEAFAKYFRPSQIGIVQAERDFHAAKIICATVQTIKSPTRLARVLRYGKFDLVICDECHHATAESYRRLLGTVKAPETSAVLNPGGLLVGLTATPMRADNVSLRLIFQQISYSVGILELITAEPEPWLVDIKGITVYVPDLTLSDIHDEDADGDFTQAQRERAILASMQSQSRYRAAIDVLKRFPEIGKLQGIYFGSSTADAYGFADYANSAGITCEVITGKTPEEERRRIYSAYVAGELQYISNMNVLPEGIDLPMAKVVIIGLHTKFVGRHVQMVGRGTRIHPADWQPDGKQPKPSAEWQYPICYVIDLADNAHTVVTVADMIGTTEERAQGKSVRQLAKEKVIETLPTPKAPVYTPGATVRVSANSLFTSRPWRLQGQDYTLPSKYGTYVAHHEFSGGYEMLFYPKGEKGVKRLSKPMPLEKAVGFGEQHLQHAEYRERRRTDPNTRSQLASPEEVERIGRVLKHLRGRKLTRGQVQDYWDQFEGVGRSVGAWYARYMPRKTKKG